uniref:Uncharacterized protein n=1 Tax=Panagrolaimus davidi TaxID=227884 RepID=A0A914NXY1_9BILA
MDFKSQIFVDCFVFRLFSKNFSFPARTSGVLLIAGFGSYCAYRIANRYLGKGFVWTLFDAAHCDLLARADSRLLNPDPCCSKDSDRRSIISIDEFDDEENENGEKTPTSSIKGFSIRRSDRSFIQIPKNSRIRRALAASPSMKEGLAGISSMAHENNEIGRSRRNSECSSIAGSSFSEASRIRRDGRQRIPRLIANDDGDLDNDFDDSASLAPTEASEIRLLWDGDACWDDEFATTAGPSTSEDDRGIHSPTPSDISELSAFKTLKNMFESAEAGPSNIPEEDVPFWDAADLAQLIHAKCMRSTNYMYHSVIVAGSDGGGSDIVSICSGRSTKSNLSALREKYAKRSHGLWELANSRTRHDEKILLLEPSTSKSPNPMTDSGISKMSGSSSILQLTAQPQQPMIDSAIDTGFLFDDEGGVSSSSSKYLLSKSDEPLTSSSTAATTTSTSKPGIIRRTQLLTGIKEQHDSSSTSSPQHRLSSSRASERSLEWFDDP